MSEQEEIKELRGQLREALAQTGFTYQMSQIFTSILDE